MSETKGKLTLLCITEAKSVARPFIRALTAVGQELGLQVVFAGSVSALTRAAELARGGEKFVRITAEDPRDILFEAYRACPGDYVLRINDDEIISSPLSQWLGLERYLESDSWLVPRLHMWKTPWMCIAEHPFWPDYSPRLGIVQRMETPAPSAPLTPGVICCYRYLVHSREERSAVSNNSWDVPEMLPQPLPLFSLQHAERLANTTARAVQAQVSA